jgi:hypothetical protein
MSAWELSDSSSDEGSVGQLAAEMAPQTVNPWAMSDDDDTHTDASEQDVTAPPSPGSFATTSAQKRPLSPDVQNKQPRVRGIASDSSSGGVRGSQGQPAKKKHKVDFSLGTGWWLAFLLRTANLIFQPPTPVREMVHASLFSGLLSEIRHIEDLGIFQRTLFGCDNKRAAQTFARNNHVGKVEHYFTDVEYACALDGLCALHPGRYCRPMPEPIDCLTTGSACQPFSSVRDKTKNGRKTCSVIEHDDWAQTFDKFFRALDVLDVRGGYCEQVKGFSHKTEGMPENFKTPLEYFIALLRRRGYSVQLIKNNNHVVWCELPRDRLRTLFCFARSVGPTWRLAM